jgi:8-oxo-dGTP pyrophosphatase MutT (NUDIX family)
LTDATTVLSGWSAPDARQEELRQRFLALLGTGPGAVHPDRPGPHLTASALVVDAAAGRVLLCLHGRFNRWVQLGGHCEPGDATLAGAALREATEESGIAGLVVGAAPIGLDVHPVRCRYGESAHFDVRYAALAPPGAVEVCSTESRALGWFAPDMLPAPLAPATEPLVAPALAWGRAVALRGTRSSRAPSTGRPRP